MNDQNNRTATADATLASTPASTPAPTSAQPTPKTSASPMRLFFALLVVILLTGTSWFTFQHQQQLQTLQNTLEQQQQQQQALQQKTRQLDKAINRLAQYERNNGWMIETESLLSLARQQVILYKDPVQAITLLDQADRLVSRKSHPGVGELRRLIAAERQALSGHQKINRETLYFRIEALIQQIDAIKMVDFSATTQALREEELSPSTNSLREKIWHSFLRALHKLGAFVRIQHHDIAIEALLSPDEQLTLKHNLRLMLEQSQLALLRNEAPIYRASLNSAEQWVNKYFFIDATTKDALLHNLKVLAAEPLEANLPAVQESVELVRRLRLEQNLEAAPEPELTP